MKLSLTLSALTLLVIATGCGSSGAGVSSIINPPPVSAQAVYSNASINGTYSISLIRDTSENVIGSFKADGNGNITSGTFLNNAGVAGLPPCQFSVTGTYSLKSDASGTAKMVPTIPSSGACDGFLPNRTESFTIQAAQQGDLILIASSDDGILTGAAAKQ